MDPYATKVLKPDTHERLVQDIDKFAKMAGIMKHWIWTPLAEICNDDEIEWVKNFKFHAGQNKAGLIFVGTDAEPPVELRMYAMAGALTRNFIWAQVTTAQSILPHIEKGDLPEATCLLLTNLSPGKGLVPSWKGALLLDMLMDRAATGKQTVITVPHMQDIEGDFGSTFFKFLDQNYAKLQVS